MKAYKEKQYLVFKFEDGKDVRYDLSNGQTIGKSGRPVKDICTQLRGYNILSVINSFEDENYRNFLKFVDSRVNRSTAYGYNWRGGTRVDKIRNVGSFLSHIRYYSNYEQFFACGIKNIEAGYGWDISKMPKGLLKLCRDNDIKLTQKLYEAYVKDPNVFNNVINMNFYSLNKNEVLNVLIDATTQQHYYITPPIKDLIDNYNYKIQSLFTYCDNLITYEALDGLYNVLREFHDYVAMVSKISPKYEKYPKNFLTTHKIACRNYNRLKEHFEEMDFQKRIDKTLEYTCDDYKFIYPTTTQDIKDEAMQQNNCVASYIKKVIDGQCHILFMRKKDDLDHSLVTIEVRDNKIVQAKGKFNRDVTNEELEAINKWNKKFEKKEEKAA